MPSEELNLEKFTLFGGYVLLKALGRGAMGDVHFARPIHPDRNIPTPIVVKRLHGELAGRKGFVARFRHEAAVAVSVDSPHIAKVYDVGAVGDTLYIAMEYVDGWPLSKVLDAVLKSGRHASIASVVDLIAGGLRGLEALHVAKDSKNGKDLGIVHRDISPKNLMVGEDGLMRLIDLGLGKSNAQDWKTRTGVVMGSVGYMPPEQARGERVDHRADLYAVGVVAFEMLALRNYIKRGTLTAMMEGSANPKFMKPSEFRPDVPPGLDAVLEKALQFDREKRYSSAGEFLDALRDVVPPTHSDGGMTALLQELFGESKAARLEEFRRLLAAPLPDDNPEENAPTEVFVVAEGVVPLDSKPTKFVPKISSPEDAKTAATQLTGWKGRVAGKSMGSDAVVLTPISPQSAQSPIVEPVLDTRSHTSNERPPRGPEHSVSQDLASVPAQTQFPPGYPANPYMVGPQPRSVVSLPVLIVAVIFAAVIGGLIALMVAGIVTVNVNAPGTTSTKVGSEIKIANETPAPSSVQRKAPEVSSKAPDPSRAEPIERKLDPIKLSPAKKKPKRRAPKVLDSPPEPPKPAVTLGSLDRALDLLIQQADQLKASAAPDAKQKLIGVQLKAGRWKKSTNLEKKKKGVEQLKRELATLR